ncbi:hypothetical protein JCM19992_33770 [Thermostilla marina]
MWAFKFGRNVATLAAAGLALALWTTGCTPPPSEAPVEGVTGTPVDDGDSEWRLESLPPEEETAAPAEETAEEAAPAEEQPAVELTAPENAEPTEAEETEPAPAEEAEKPAMEQPETESAAEPAEVTAPEATDEQSPAESAESETSEAESAAEQPFEIQVPAGLPPVPVPDDNPMTTEKVELGNLLYFDPRMSKDGTISCATCHDPKKGWAEHTPTSTGIGKQVGGRNAPTVLNAAYAPAQFWDGRAASLEEQAVGPVANPIEMGNTLENMVETLKGIPGYVDRFEKVFGTEPTADGFAKAVAAFERTILAGNSPYDRYQAGDESAMSEAAVRGMNLFEEVGCADCHTPPLFSSYEYYNAGVGMDKENPDIGRKEVTGDDADTGAFRVPSLRNVADTAPYFHDGSAATLEEAVALMAAGGKDNPHRSDMFDTVREAKITPEQQKDLVEFLKALSGDIPAVEPPELP